MKIMKISLSIKTTLPKENVIESDASTTQSYLEDDMMKR